MGLKVTLLEKRVPMKKINQRTPTPRVRGKRVFLRCKHFVHVPWRETDVKFLADFALAFLGVGRQTRDSKIKSS